MDRAVWKPVEVKQKEYTKNYYFPDFVDFSYGDPVSLPARRGGKQQDIEATLRFRRAVDKRVTVGIGDGSRAVEVDVNEVVLYVMPFGLVQFSVEVGMENVEYNDMVAVLQLLRSNCDYVWNEQGKYTEAEAKQARLHDFVSAAMLPVACLQMCHEPEMPTRMPCYSDLTANGNKLKLFQIVETEEVEAGLRETVLYNLGCLAPMQEPIVPQKGSYYERTMEEGQVSVFEGWSALALFDSFTMLSEPQPDFRRDIWANDYFGMIYIYELYRQAFLYHYNGLFRMKRCDIVKLESDILLFERRYRFERFSYNFLPLEIGRAMERALELEESTQALRSMVTQASAVYDKESDERMNTVMTGLTLITLCSTVWDLFSLLEVAIVPDNGASFYRLGVGILVLALAILALVLLRRRR